MSSTEKTETEYHLGTPKIEGGETTLPDLPKRGHLCCGGCCDVRRASMIVNAVNTGIVLLSIFTTLAARNVAADMDDDRAQDLAEAPIGAWMAVMCIEIVLSGVAAYGARSYNQWLVGVGAVMYSVHCVMSLIILNIGAVMYSAFFAYPHFFLISEIRKGIMTPENYPNEEQSAAASEVQRKKAKRAYAGSVQQLNLLSRLETHLM
eukprot:CAMPEP_0113558864 /NCGR_PEP_ID=MMETSP0015_2-20120614/18585_1 /TAXON_ID=2838 /ORGANISM="Odontella" /LENGTH=205 /DNA_ID=CAMNT_0000460451 /DNA_START=76 /DNA_END=694 /DNA_ORIENTATION=+ /assembly_acc=CAM_ASM_000160